MKRTFASVMSALHAVYHRHDAVARSQHRELLRHAGSLVLPSSAALVRYYEYLLFMLAHPATPTLLAEVEAELRRIQRFVRSRRLRSPTTLSNTGLPYTDTVMRSSHDCTRWLLHHPDCRVTLEEYDEATLDLNAVLRLTLPLLERLQTTAELSNEELCDTLGIRPSRTLECIVAELSRFDDRPFVKDHLFDALGVHVRITPKSGRLSTAGNRLPTRQTFFHTTPAPAFDANSLINEPLSNARRLRTAERNDVVNVIKNAMVLTGRETDPATYLDTSSLRLYDLARGISVALFGMTADRQLGLESYVGFTSFKNGMPVAYGGAWVLDHRSEFGMNIFEPYRGGESGYMMCQLLRVYRQVFDITYFEIDAYQFGRDNPDGISSGAFWFYYKYGFRPVHRAIATLARREKARLGTRRGLRTSKPLLRTFTESNVALRFSRSTPPPLSTIAARVTRLIQREFHGNRIEAELACVKQFTALTEVPRRLNHAQRSALTEMSFVACALSVTDDARLTLLAKMVVAKPSNVYHYQQLLTEFLLAGTRHAQSSQ